VQRDSVDIHIHCQLIANEVGDIRALPIAPSQDAMGASQRLKPRLEDPDCEWHGVPG
jgi:hypothetical protein